MKHGYTSSIEELSLEITETEAGRNISGFCSGLSYILTAISAVNYSYKDNVTIALGVVGTAALCLALISHYDFKKLKIEKKKILESEKVSNGMQSLFF